MPTNHTNPLPDGFIDELLDQFRVATRLHLIKNLYDHKPVPSQAGASKASDTGKTSTPSTQELQNFIFANITRVGPYVLSEYGFTLDAIFLLCQIATQGHLCSLAELNFELSYQVLGSNSLDMYRSAADKGLLDKIHSLLPSLLSSLPKLQSLRPPKIVHGRHRSLFFSRSGLFPEGQSSQLEKLCLTSSGLDKAHFKYLAHHSNYMFPSLTQLDISSWNLNSKDLFDAQDDNSIMHYLLQWIEKSMPKLTHLSFAYCQLTTTDIAAHLANSSILSRLESLDLSYNRDVEAEGWKTFFTSPQWTNSQSQKNGDKQTPRLTKLELNHDSHIQFVIPFLTQHCPHLANLTTLGLDWCGLNDQSIQSICDSEWIRRLESLSLLNNKKLTSESIRMIADCDGMRNLTSLQLSPRTGQFSVDLLRYITHSQHVSKLMKVDLDFSGISSDPRVDQVLLDFFHSPKASFLKQLFLHSANIPQSTMKSIFSSPTLSNLELLNVWNNSESRVGSDCTNEWINVFVSSPNCGKLNKLTLCQCYLVDSNIFAISHSPYLSSLRKLDLAKNPRLTDDSVKYLAQSEVLRLNRLGLAYNPLLTPLTFHYLAKSPQILSYLWELRVFRCPLIRHEHREIIPPTGWFDGVVRDDSDSDE